MLALGVRHQIVPLPRKTVKSVRCWYVLATAAGLCRTCEIFGAGQLVVSSLSVVDDPQFSALSVSAQHWLNISEVRVHFTSGSM